jgi:hypothetical protein
MLVGEGVGSGVGRIVSTFAGVLLLGACIQRRLGRGCEPSAGDRGGEARRAGGDDALIAPTFEAPIPSTSTPVATRAGLVWSLTDDAKHFALCTLHLQGEAAVARRGIQRAALLPSGTRKQRYAFSSHSAMATEH